MYYSCLVQITLLKKYYSHIAISLVRAGRPGQVELQAFYHLTKPCTYIKQAQNFEQAQLNYQYHRPKLGPQWGGSTTKPNSSPFISAGLVVNGYRLTTRKMLSCSWPGLNEWQRSTKAIKISPL